MSVIHLLSDLVAIDSVNPTLVPGAAGESAMAERVADELRALGADVEVHDAAPGRPNVVGVIEGRAPGRTLMLCGHTDTVGVAGMDSPFAPLVRDGRLYGRGAQDMKGGLAAALCAMRALAQRPLERGRVVLAAVADEEDASRGAEALAARWKADGWVIAEPTDLTIGVGHKGFSWAEVVVHGRAAHGSRPKEGRDAILHMGRVLTALESLDRGLQSRVPHPLLGAPSLHASIVQGGRELSTYPDRCALQLERRTLIGEPVDAAFREAAAIVEALRAADPAFTAETRFTFGRPAYETPEGHALPGLIEDALRRGGRTPARGGMTFWTDAGILGPAGTPCVIFGPGGEGLHGLVEHVRLDEVEACAAVLEDVARRF